MYSHIVKFEKLPWQTPMKGLRFKAHQDNGLQLRVVEFSSEFIEPDWCVKGHAGYLLEGVLEVQFHDHTVTYQAGDGLIIPAGSAHGHKARSVTPIARVVLFEEL